MCPNDFGHFSAFFELWTVFWAVFRYPSGKLKTQKVAPGNSLNFPKEIKIIIFIFGSFIIHIAVIHKPGNIVCHKYFSQM